MPLDSSFQPTVRVSAVATATLTLPAGLQPGDAIGTWTLKAGDLVLLIAQPGNTGNGLYRSMPVPERDANYSTVSHGPNGAYDLFPGMIVSDENTKNPLPLLFMSQLRTVMFSPNST